MLTIDFYSTHMIFISFFLDVYTIADIAIWPWVYALHQNYDDAIKVSGKASSTITRIISDQL